MLLRVLEVLAEFPRAGPDPTLKGAGESPGCLRGVRSHDSSRRRRGSRGYGAEFGQCGCSMSGSPAGSQQNAASFSTCCL